MSANDIIISDDPDVALEVDKSISKTEAKEVEAVRQVHATHARIVTESVPEPTKRIKSGKVTSDPPKKLKGVEGLSEGTRTIPGVLDESTVVSATSNEGTGTKPGVPNEEKDITEENVILEWGSEQESEYSEEDKLDDKDKDDKEGYAEDEGDDHISDIQDTDDEDDETESDKDDIYKYKIRVRKDEDVEMTNVEVEDSDKGDEEVTDAAKADAEKTLEDTIDAEINLILEVKIQSEVPHIQSPSMLKVPVSVISEPTVLTPVQETSTATPLRVAKLEKDMSELKKIDISIEALAALKTQVPFVVDNYLGSKVGDDFQKELKKHTADLTQKYSLQ
ncbi:hypothetical protein Tco_1432797 [Tanacetum coccineum]